MKRTAWGLVGLIVVLLVLMRTVGKENDFGFACFLVFVVAVLALVGVGVAALVRRGRTT